MGRNRPKEGKILDKMHFFLQTPTNLTSPPSKTARNGYYLSLAYDLVHRVTSGSGATSKTPPPAAARIREGSIRTSAHKCATISTRLLAHMRTYTRTHTSMRAPSNSDVVFLLSQVSHLFLFSPDFRAIFSTHSFHNLHTSKRLFEE